MSDTFSNGGTNDSDLNYSISSDLTLGSDSSTIVNDSSGTLDFTPSTAVTVSIDGNLTNSGTISYKPSSAVSGTTWHLGNSSSTLTQTGGTLSFSQLDATTGPSVYLYYKTINNDATSTIDLEAAGAATISGENLTDLTNAGTFKVVDTSGNGMSSKWGNGSGTFDNSGSFSIDDSSATSGSTTNLNFNTITNESSGTVSFDVPASSTAIFTVGSGGFTNDGTWSIVSHGSGGGNIQFTGGSSAYINNGTINVTDASLTFNQALTGTNGTVNLSNGANVTLDAADSGAGQTFNFSGADNTLNVVNGTTFTGVIRGFTQGDKLDLNIEGTPTYDSSTGILTITSGSNVYTFDIGTGYSKGTFSDSSDGIVTYAEVTPCYLAGSMLRTSTGDQAVETLAIGDELVTWDPTTSTEKVATIVWIGTQKSIVKPHLPDDEAGYPVRILKNAIANGVPYKDMLVTAEHCLFFDGKFVPARMMVNGRSIFFDRDLMQFDIYHIETEEHSVITADGMLSETFLNTNNHETFRQSSKIVSLRPPRHLTWDDDAAAPLGVSREFVEPLFREVEARAISAGITQKDIAPELTDEDNLHLLTEAGASIRPAREHNGRVIFMIPTGVKSVRVVSNASRPSDVIGPFVDDRRYLGVAIGEITMFEAGQNHIITVHLTDKELDGWNTLEWEDTRWTSGNALLPLGERHPNSVALMAIQIKKTGPYLLSDTILEKAALQA